MRKTLAVAACLICVVLTAPGLAQTPGFQEGFEEGLGKFTVESWRGTPAEQLTEAVTHGGKKAVQLTGGAAADDVTVLWMKSPAVKLLPGERYAVSIWVKTEGASAVELKVVLPEGVEATGLKSEKLTGTREWTKLEQSFTVAKKVQPKSVGLWMTGPGKLWADDFQLIGKTGLEWQKRIEIDPTAATTEKDFQALLAAQGLKEKGFVNWFTGRWPYISFIGGMAMGNRSEDLEFFYEKPFKWWTEVLDYVMEDGGTRYGIRARIHRYKEPPTPLHSYLLTVRTDRLLPEYYPSTIYANGRKVWDRKKHPLLQGKLCVPFSVEDAVDPVIDFVVDKAYTPDTKGLAFRMFFVTNLGEPGVKVDLKDVADEPEGSPADKLEKFAFGVFTSDYDFWGDRGLAFADIRKDWKPNFVPDYPTDKVYLSPTIGDLGSKGKYHDFMVTYGGCNVFGGGTDAALVKANAAHLRGGFADIKNAASGKAVLAFGPKLDCVWFTGEGDNGVGNVKVVADAKQATGAPERCVSVHEPFPPALSKAHEYERGTDILCLKNEEDPQYNLMMAMCRGAGHSFGRPFGYYWEQTHYPYPSLDEKLHACLLYYLSGGSWIAAEAENAPAFEKEIVAEWVLPYVQALRFAMVHPARGQAVVPVGILWGEGDKWWVPYNPFGQMDTFVRHIEYEHATKTLKCEPAFTHPFPWTPPDRARWNFQTAGHLGWFIDSIPEIQGYDMMDVFFPKFGDACTARITRLLTGTPYGPVDFLYLDKTPVETLRACGMLAVLGHASVNKELEGKLTQCLEAGVPVFLGAQHARNGVFGLRFEASQPAKGEVAGKGAFEGKMSGAFDGKVHAFKGEGWEPVVLVGDRPLIVAKTVGKAIAYVYLGELVKDGGAAIRPVLAAMGEAAAPLVFSAPDDYMEYVAYRKGAGAWVALFNHGNIVVGCDRLKEPRATPPEPLCSKPRGPWKGEIRFRPDRLGLDPKAALALYEVEGIDGHAFDDVIAGRKTFTVKEVAAELKDGVVSAKVEIAKRAQYVIAPKGQGESVFFGKP